MQTATAPAAAGRAAATALALRIPAGLFSVVMGVGGLAAAWRAAARAYSVSPWAADALLAVSCALWLGLAAAQAVKAALAPARLRAELEHPVTGSLAALGPASLLLLAAGLSVHSRAAAQVLLWIGAAAAVALCVHQVGRWLVRPVEPALVTPALYLPPVAGTLLAAVAAGAVGRTDAGWLFFGAGAISWIVLAAVLLGRYLAAGELPPALRPLLAIELAPPAVALVAWQGLAGPAPSAPSRALLGYALLVALLLVRLAGRFREVPFGAGFWAFTFPVTALATGALRMGGAAPGSAAAALALPLFVAANAVVAWIAFRTVALLARGELLPPAPRER